MFFVITKFNDDPAFKVFFYLLMDMFIQQFVLQFPCGEFIHGMFFVTMNDDAALNKVIHLHIPINMLYRYYCMFTTCNVHVQVTFIRDLWIFTEPIVGMCHISLLTTVRSSPVQDFCMVNDDAALKKVITYIFQ